MKKFISFVMAGAMVASLVPATAFAKGEVSATAKVVDAKDLQKGESEAFNGNEGPEVQLKISSVDYQRTNGVIPELDVTVTLDNAEFVKLSDYTTLVNVTDENGTPKIGTPGTVDTEAVGTEDPDGSYFYVKANEADLATNQYIKIPTFKETTKTTTVAQQVAQLVKDGYTLVADDYDSDKGLYTSGIATKSGKTDVDLTKLVDKTETISAADQLTTWKTEKGIDGAYVRGNVKITSDVTGAGDIKVVEKEVDRDDNTLTFTFQGYFAKNDIIAIDLDSILTKTSVGTKATVSIDSKAVNSDDLVFATIVDKGIKVSVRKSVDVAEDEVVKLNSNGVKIESVVGDFTNGQEFELKLSKGFEFSKVVSHAPYTFGNIDDNTVTFTYSNTVSDDEFTIKGDDIQIEATSAKSGAVATLTVKALAKKGDSDTFADTASCEVAKVVDYKVNLSVDADEDLPVIYSGVNVDNDGITDDSDHLSLEVTAKESFPGAWSMRQGFNFNLPEGVYVTAVKNIDAENFYQGGGNSPVSDQEGAWEKAFKEAYQDGDHKNFEFKKRVFDDVNTNVTDNDPAELSFQLELVADPTFEGDVTLKMEGALLDTQEVKIAKFVKPYTVKAEQNDVIIDYRNTEVKNPVVITEAEEGLWEKGTTFRLSIEDDLLTFEDDPTFTIDKDSDMELKDDKATKGTIQFAVKDESDKAASISISDMKLFMSRSIPAGAYDLEIGTDMNDAYNREVLFAPDATSVAKWTSGDRPSETTTKKDSYVDDVCDYSEVVKAAFINVVTSGRDNDNLFTTKVVVPVGEAYLLAGEAKVELDAPAYISAAGYTMLPVRAISKALGVNTNNVLWNAETRTVTVMYAQRIITMTVGQKSVYVNGSPIPTSAAPEIKDGRTFLPLRDLGTALGVTNVNWDAATKTATLN